MLSVREGNMVMSGVQWREKEIVADGVNDDGFP